ncbi:hypothetical protein T492DRAFT_1119222, partial [Pavlovales sp. CCMP2436]
FYKSSSVVLQVGSHYSAAGAAVVGAGRASASAARALRAAEHSTFSYARSDSAIVRHVGQHFAFDTSHGTTPHAHMVSHSMCLLSSLEASSCFFCSRCALAASFCACVAASVSRRWLGLLLRQVVQQHRTRLAAQAIPHRSMKWLRLLLPSLRRIRAPR